MNPNEPDKKATQEKLDQLKLARVQVKKALEEVEEKPKSERGQETINRLKAQLEKINADILSTHKALGGGKDADLEMMDILMELEKEKRSDS